MSGSDHLISDMVERLFGDHVTGATLEAAESGGFQQDLWDVVEEHGLASMLSASDDDSELGWHQVFMVMRAAGAHCLPLPLGESIAASFLLHRSGLGAQAGRIGLASGSDLRLHQTKGGWSASGLLRRVPWGRNLASVVSSLDHEGEGRIVVVPVAACAVMAGANLVGEPRDELVVEDVPVAVARCAQKPMGTEGFAPDIARQLGALLRAGQMAGAIGAILDTALTYAGERRQFARAIGGFQAVQHQLAVLAEESAAAAVAAEQAFRSVDSGRDHGFAIAVAKIRVGEAAGRVAAIAHQVLGAMGFAREHRLHHATRRLWAWRGEFGAECFWAGRLAQMVIPLGAAGLSPFVTVAQSGAKSEETAPSSPRQS